MTVSAIACKVYLGPVALANIVDNPGFETAGAGGADVWASWTEQTGAADETTLVHSGGHAAKLEYLTGPPTWPAGPGVVGSNNSLIVPGHRMRLSFWSRGDGVNTGSLRYSVYDQSNGAFITANGPPGDPAHPFTGNTSAEYQETIYDFTVPAGCTNIIYTFAHSDFYSGGIATVYLDDVSLVDFDGYTFVDQSADVLQRPGVTWERGLMGAGLTDLLAGTGMATFTLDNSASSVTGRLAGKYSPGHANCLAAFGTGTHIKITLNVDGGGETTEFLGRIASIRPSAGPYRDEVVEVVAHDWIGYLATQQLGVQTLAVNRRADQAITTVLAGFPIQPAGTSFSTGKETFPTLFDTEDSQTSMASFFSKMARNEIAPIYLRADGTLVVENRHTRPLALTSSFTLDGTMSELWIEYDQRDIANIIIVIVYPKKVDTANVILWSLTGAPAIHPGETLTFVCPFSDPVGGERISASGVVNPVTLVEFGGTPNFVSDEFAAFLSQANEVGSNQLIAHLTNTGTQTGYLNDFQVQGKGIYHYSPLECEARDDYGILGGDGERREVYRLEQIADPNTGRNYAEYIKDRVSRQHIQARLIRFNANQTTTLAAAAAAAEVSQRFTLTEAATGVSEDFFINHLAYRYIDNQLDVDLLAVPASLHTCWIWDTSTYDNTDGEGWTL